ncbi:MAG: M23 family metallopeptidase [Deltaproteobacteria bacterium]|nr:M23 family metallopeptidase [Deltaproteobacteria bacterium]
MISDGFNSPRPGLPRHGGVDIMYPRRPEDSRNPALNLGTPNGAKWTVMPDGMPVFAASDGVLWSAMDTPSGYSVVIDHSPRVIATYYAHLEQLFVPKSGPGKGGQRIQAGQMLGIVGASPLDAEGLKHLHFEVWLGPPSERIDPCRIMRDWEVLGEHHVGPTREVAATSVVARNGQLELVEFQEQP